MNNFDFADEELEITELPEREEMLLGIVNIAASAASALRSAAWSARFSVGISLGGDDTASGSSGAVMGRPAPRSSRGRRQPMTAVVTDSKRRLGWPRASNSSGRTRTPASRTPLSHRAGRPDRPGLPAPLRRRRRRRRHPFLRRHGGGRFRRTRSPAHRETTSASWSENKLAPAGFLVNRRRPSPDAAGTPAGGRRAPTSPCATGGPLRRRRPWTRRPGWLGALPAAGGRGRSRRRGRTRRLGLRDSGRESAALGHGRPDAGADALRAAVVLPVRHVPRTRPCGRLPLLGRAPRGRRFRPLYLLARPLLQRHRHVPARPAGPPPYGSRRDVLQHRLHRRCSVSRTPSRVGSR